jgi:hypothetical protein
MPADLSELLAALERPTRFFPRDRDMFVRSEDVRDLVVTPGVELFRTLNNLGVVSRLAGFLRITDTVHEEALAVCPIGNPSIWAHDYEGIVDGKGRLAFDTGLDTREVQSMATTLLRGHHVIHYGTYELNGIRVDFSGVQAYCDEGFCKIVHSLFKMVYDHRRKLIDDVCRATGFSYYFYGMDIIEVIAELLGISRIDDVVQHIVDTSTVATALTLGAVVPADNFVLQADLEQLRAVQAACALGEVPAFDRLGIGVFN